MRQKWIYEYYGRIAGLILAIFMAFAHHFFAFAYATIVWYIRRRRDIRYSTKIFAPIPIKNKYYEELEHINFDKATKLMEIMESETKETFMDEDEKEFNKLITRGITMQLEDDAQNKDENQEQKEEKSECIVEGIIPFKFVGICGPYGERIVDRAIPLREPLPDEKPPIVYDIEEVPKHLITDKQGFFGLIELAKKEIVIIKTDRTADGHLKGYYGGRISEKTHDNMVHMGYKHLFQQWNQSIFDFYEKNHFLPRVPSYRKQPVYLKYRQFDPNKTFYENLDFFLTDTFFHRESRNGADVLLIQDLSEVFWTAVLLERRMLSYTFSDEKIELKRKIQIYSFVKRMTIFYYPAHREADRHFDRYGKPRINNLPDIPPPIHDIFVPAEDFFETYEYNYTNICPIADNYLCNTFVPLHESEGTPCYCALIEPFDTDPRYEWDEGCIRRSEFVENLQYISLTISSFIPNELVPSNAQGLLFSELITVALVNATTLPGAFQPQFLHFNPTVVFRLHCSSLMQEFTIQFGIITRKFTTADDNDYETDYLYLSPKRFWEEVEDQNTLQFLENMGINIIRYGIVDNLTDINEPNMESSYQYPKDYESEEQLLQHISKDIDG
uniref:Uncharacterized protein n=1 Tax=Panagrolaimus sp. ES5 TaxID=591445 RepID=A0AC34FC61_9BILA